MLSCDLEPMGFEEGFENASDRERPGERCSLSLLPTQATHQEKQLRHIRIHLDTRAVAHSEYSEAKQLDARVPVDTK